MRALPDGLQNHLDGGVTTLCHCWRLRLRSGDVLGFTDHDRDVVYDGVTHEAAAGFTASEMESAVGFAVDNMTAAGALSSERLSAARLQAGDFDHAQIEVWRVNWQQVSQRVLLRAGHLGEVSHGPAGFSAELRGPAHLLGQVRGRLYHHGCDAVVGDGRCGVDLSDPAFCGQAHVMAQRGACGVVISGLENFATDWFTRGTLECVTGAQAGRVFEVKRHRQEAGLGLCELWHAPDPALAAGDVVMLRAGCDRQFATCCAKFANAVNFRGFPHMPGNDFVMASAQAAGRYDGQSLNR
jgi:uncharacterized phage protein (TIGR02218 family)